MPSGIQYPKDTVELCELINQIKGWPALSEEEKEQIQLIGIRKVIAGERGRGTIYWGIWLFRLFRIGYLLGFASLIVSGFSWLVVGLVVATWWAKGAASMCVQRERHGNTRAWELSLHVMISVGLLIALWIVSIAKLINILTIKGML